jgi:sugar transferase EpsL
VRPGFHGKPFVVYKFRTMVDIFDAEGKLLPDKERLTGLGRWLRRLSIDELPQLWNVLKGELSLVGPRPQLLKYVQRCTPEQMRRHDVKPGISGWAQVNGRNSISWEQRFKLDVWYVDHVTFLLDLHILWRTIWIVLSQAGISAHGHVTMPEFLGSHAQLAAAGAGGHGPLAGKTTILDDSPIVADGHWEGSSERPPRRRREFVRVAQESHLNGTDGSFDEGLLSAFGSPVGEIVADGGGSHADALLVDGVLHGPMLVRSVPHVPAVNGHARPEVQSLNGRAANGHRTHSTNGHAATDQVELSGTSANETVATRKPR